MVKKTTIKKYTPSSKEKYMCAKHKKFLLMIKQMEFSPLFLKDHILL